MSLKSCEELHADTGSVSSRDSGMQSESSAPTNSTSNVRPSNSLTENAPCTSSAPVQSSQLNVTASELSTANNNAPLKVSPARTSTNGLSKRPSTTRSTASPALSIAKSRDVSRVSAEHRDVSRRPSSGGVSQTDTLSGAQLQVWFTLVV